MPGQATTPPTANGPGNPARVESSRLERAVALLHECVDLLRDEIKEARNDEPKQEGGHGDYSTGDQPAG